MNKRIIIIVPTLMEAEGLGQIAEGGDVVVCGVGLVKTALVTQRILMYDKPDVVILAGIAGADARSGLEIGRSVIVASETIADMGAFRGAEFHDIFATHYECGFCSVNFSSVASNSVNAAGAPFINREASIENMEGAGFFAACEGTGVQYFELRTISNIIGDPRDKWNIPLALENLARDLKILVEEIGKSF